MYISKNQIVPRIRQVAKKYREYLVGKTFMFVYDNQYIEVMFKADSFFHLTGVASTLTAKKIFISKL